ncbi:hypothetical protein FB45DRAFT_743500, partial [Roridomyces roridus]
MPLADLVSRLYMLAVQLSDAAERRRKEAANETSTGNLRIFFNDLRTRLEGTYELTPRQKTNIRGVAQDLVFDPMCTVYYTMSKDVERDLRKGAQKFDLENVFGVPVHEKQVVQWIKRACSSVRNSYRAEILASIAPGKKFVELKQFTYDMAVKFKKSAGDAELSEMYSVHVAMLV